MAATKVVYSKVQGPQRPMASNPGPGAIVVAQSIYEQSTTKKHQLGERLQIGNRVFYYAKAGAALVAGMMNESAAFGGAPSSIQTNLTVPTVTDGSNAAGQNRATVTLNGTDVVTANMFADGYLSGYGSSAAYGQGQTYKIKSHPAATGPANLLLTLYDDIVVTFSTSGTVNLLANEFNGIQSLNTTSVGFCVGVALVVIASGSYGWVQTYGPCCCLVAGTATNETAMVMGVSATGATDIQVAGSSSLATPEVGFMMHLTTATTKYGMMFLKIMA